MRNGGFTNWTTEYSAFPPTLAFNRANFYHLKYWLPTYFLLLWTSIANIISASHHSITLSRFRIGYPIHNSACPATPQITKTYSRSIQLSHQKPHQSQHVIFSRASRDFARSALEENCFAITTTDSSRARFYTSHPISAPQEHRIQYQGPQLQPLSLC